MEKTSIVVFLLLIHTVFAGGQIRERDREDQPTEPVKGLTLPSPTVPAMFSALDPDQYTVGPSDRFVLSIGGTGILVYPLTVTLEGTVFIPTVGVITIGGLSLTEARKNIIDAVAKKYSNKGHIVTFSAPRRVLVSVTGVVRTTTPSEFYATDRVDVAISWVTATMREELERLRLQGESVPPIPITSRRNLLLRRHDGTVIHVDLDGYYATRRLELNPYLREGDVVIVPPIAHDHREVGVYGGVRVPGRFEFVEGESLRDLLALAYGVNEGSRLDSSIFTRYTNNGKSLVDSVVDLRPIPTGGSDILVRPGDRIFIPEEKRPRDDFRVSIEGEVRFPGSQPIIPSTTRLSEVLRRAGGVTEFASLKLAKVLRKSGLGFDKGTERLLSLRGNINPNDSGYIRLENELRLRGDLVAVNFEDLVRHDDLSQDILLQSEDIISIPRRTNTVYVFGQVIRPTYVEVAPDKDIDYYIQKAGGATDRSREGDAVVIKGVTRQWLQPDETTIDEGDYIWVPKVRERTFEEQMIIVSQVASVVSAAITLILLSR